MELLGEEGRRLLRLGLLPGLLGGGSRWPSASSWTSSSWSLPSPCPSRAGRWGFSAPGFTAGSPTSAGAGRTGSSSPTTWAKAASLPASVP